MVVVLELRTADYQQAFARPTPYTRSFEQMFRPVCGLFRCGLSVVPPPPVLPSQIRCYVDCENRSFGLLHATGI